MRNDTDCSRNVSMKFLAACQNGQVDKAKSLVEEHGIDDWTIHRHRTTGDTALHLAAREGHLEVVRYLCEADPWLLPHDLSCRVNVTNGDTKRPLHEAGQFARGLVLRYLLDRSAEVDALKRADWTPLMLACTQTGPEALECAAALLESGADSRLRNKDGWTPLLLACRAGDPDVVRLLIRHSPDCVEDRSNNGRSALHVAAFHAHRETLAVLLDARPELLESRDSSGCTPLLESVKSRVFAVTRDLIDRGADVRVSDNIGQNVLHVAASVGNLPVIRYAVEKLKIIRDAGDRFGVIPLQIAEKNKQNQAVELLMSYRLLS